MFAEYQAQFLTLERFSPGSFMSEREWIAQFVSSLCTKAVFGTQYEHYELLVKLSD